MNAILVHRNLLIVSEDHTLQTYDIRLRERTSVISTTKKCISLFIDSSVNWLFASCKDAILIFMVSYDRVTFLGLCALPGLGEIYQILVQNNRELVIASY